MKPQMRKCCKTVAGAAGCVFLLLSLVLLVLSVLAYYFHGVFFRLLSALESRGITFGVLLAALLVSIALTVACFFAYEKIKVKPWD